MGAGRPQVARRAAGSALRLMAVYIAVTATLFLTLPEWIAGLFGPRDDSPDFAAAVALCRPLFAWMALLGGIDIVTKTAFGVLRGGRRHPLSHGLGRGALLCRTGGAGHPGPGLARCRPPVVVGNFYLIYRCVRRRALDALSKRKLAAAPVGRTGARRPSRRPRCVIPWCGACLMTSPFPTTARTASCPWGWISCGARPWPT